MINKKKWIANLSVLFGSTLIAVSAMAAQYSLNINIALTQDDPMYKGLERMKQRVESRTDGKVELRLFTGSQLGKDEDVLEQARAGANVAVLVDTGRLGVFTPSLSVLGAPYIVTDISKLDKLVTSDLFNGWANDLRQKAGLEILSFNWWQGSRHLLTNKPITQPADLKGIRMRTPGAPVWLETIKAMGATPTPLGWTEVYTGLQQHVIDGAEAQMPAVYGSRLYEVISHITKTGHIQLISGLVGSSQWFDSLPAEYQAIVKEEALSAGDYATELTQAKLTDYENLMTKEGVTISEVDITPFVKATESVYQTLNLQKEREQVMQVLGQ
ncbi:C4-dicarboxylate TRAP transporter substrate-binding protein [Gynuella sp.]|uniref:C4-dicarboxylate TRAP transporter substrate-binding protein n=1 Tax=Gynuella sp. TaxID=2969146 RepID=UPI003D0A1258